jgi:hypothetical protein
MGAPMMGGPPQMGQAPQMMPMGMNGPPMDQGFMGGVPPPMGQAPQMMPMGMNGTPMDQGFMGGAPPLMGQAPEMMPTGMGGTAMDQGFTGAPPLQQGIGGGLPMEIMPMGVPSMMASPLMTQLGSVPEVAPQSQAEAELAKLEAKKKAKDEKHRQKEIEQLTKMMRTGQRDSGDRKTCAQIICFWGIFNALLWTAPLLGDSWWHKCWQGMGIEKLTIDMGLFNMHTAVVCKGSSIGATSAADGMCNAMLPYTERPGSGEKGAWAITELQDKICKEIPDGCPIMQKMYYSGFAPLIGFPAAAAFEVLSVFLLYFYWHLTPRGMIRTMAVGVGALSPLAGFFGLTGWMIISPMIQELPRLWAQQKGMSIVNSAAFGLNETFVIPMGWCFMLALVVGISSTTRMVVSRTLGPHFDEPESFNNDESSRLLEEATRTYDAQFARPAA